MALQAAALIGAGRGNYRPVPRHAGKTSLNNSTVPSSGNYNAVASSPDCPVNLLGRDLMTKFNIAIVPTDQGMKAIKMEKNNVVLGKGPPTTCKRKHQLKSPRC